MANDTPPGDATTPNEAPLRNLIALTILGVSAGAIMLLAVAAVWVDHDNAMMIFNITLPVFSSWVGTVLAFYFGRENFESANKQVRQLINKLSPEELAASPIESIMRKLDVTTHLKLPADDGEAQVPIKDLRDKLVGEVSRMPVVSPNAAPKYLIHGSTIDRYLAEGGKDTDTLDALIAAGGQKGLGFGADRGFVLVAAKDSIAAAKAKLDRAPTCQDIFVTADGKADQPLIGWVSNVRLSKFLQA